MGSSFPAHVVAMLIQDTPSCNGSIVVCVNDENEASKLIQVSNRVMWNIINVHVLC